MMFTESVSSPPPTRAFSVSMSKAENQMSKGQDENFVGLAIHPETKEHVHWMFNFDGHGSNHCIRKIRATNPVQFLFEPDPIAALSDYLFEEKAIPENISSGAVVVLAMIYQTRIEIYTCGDSQAIVYKDGEMVYLSVPHDSEREDEKVRVVTNPNVSRIDTTATSMKLLTPSIGTMRPSSYVVYKDGNMLAPTRAIGHNNKVFHDSELHIIDMESTSEYRVVLGSDGVFDLLFLENEDDRQVLAQGNADDVVNFYTKRWLQEWSYYKNDTDVEPTQVFKYRREDCDDLSACVAKILPV
jgi:serine/threonine protein phosphatase PrpC